VGVQTVARRVFLFAVAVREVAGTCAVPVGDAVMCTNLVYGRGMSTAAWMVDMFAAALDRHGE
jgi:hypothetical protein